MTEVVDVVVPVPGVVASLEVQPGKQVKAGDPILVLQAMKMEFPIEAEVSGRVTEVLVMVGMEIEAGTVAARIEKL